MMNPEVKEGDKIVLVYMKDEQGMTPGTKGVVTRVTRDPFEEDDLLISVDWENGRPLSIVSAEDLWMLDSDEKEPIQEQEEDIETEYGSVIAKSTPFNATATATCEAMKSSLKNNNIKFLEVGRDGTINLPGSDNQKYRSETQQRFIQWYNDVIRNPDAYGNRGKIFEGLIGGVFGGDVVNNETKSGEESKDKTDVVINNKNVSIKFRQSTPNSMDLGGITNAVKGAYDELIGDTDNNIYTQEEKDSILLIIDERNNIKSGNLKDLFNNLFNTKPGKKFIEKTLDRNDSFKGINYFMIGNFSTTNKIEVRQYKYEYLKNKILQGDYYFNGGIIGVKDINSIKHTKVKILFPQYVKTQRNKYDSSFVGKNQYTLYKFEEKENDVLKIVYKDETIGKVVRYIEFDEEYNRILKKDMTIGIPKYKIILNSNKKIPFEVRLEYINIAIQKDLEEIDNFVIPYIEKIYKSKKIKNNERIDFIDRLKDLSDKYSKKLYIEKSKLGSEKSKEGQLSKIIGGEREATLDPSIVKNIRKNPVRFIKKVLDLYKDNEEVKKYLSTLTEQTKEDITKKLIDSDVDPSVIDDLLGSLTDEDITDLVMRNLDRKLFKGGDKEKNVRDYFEKYIKSLADRAEQDPNDDFDVEDEFLYGGEEPEKSKIGRKQFKNELLPLQVELLKLQEDVKKTGKAIAVVFEGRDSAGKGSTIKRMVEYLDPKYYNIIALGIPTKEERQDWFGRYEKHIEPGKINFFDRSWYNRGIVEPVMGYSSEEEYIDFMENVNDFEQSLIDRGIELVKFWLSITPETQKKRFQMRKASPLKYWKFSPNDEKSIDKWDKYTEYKNKVLKQTKEAKPWTVVDTNDKRAGILNAFRHLLKVVDYEGKDEENVGSVYPEVVTTIKEKEMTEAGNHHWSDWQRVSDVLGRENKILYDFFEKLRLSSVMNMLESTHFIYSGSDYLRRYIQFNQYENYDEDKYEELYDAADEAKHAMIRLSIESLERKGKETSLENINSEVKSLARQALQAFIMMK